MTARELAERQRRAAREAASQPPPAGRDVPELAFALQRSAGNARLARAVRVDGGKTEVDAKYYGPKGKGRNIGSKHSVSALMADNVKRVFEDEGELKRYAEGKTDYIGDVVTQSKGTFWYRLPPNTMTVLGEMHHNPDGNVPDVIEGLGTSRFMYEPFNELAAVKALDVPMTGTQARLDELNKGIEGAKQVDRKLFNPDLENIVIKALTGAAIARNEYIAASEAKRAKKMWKARASASEYSYGERTALYLSMAIHIAADVAKHDFGPENFVESRFVASGRQLKKTYLAFKTELDTFMQAKDKSELVGIYELTEPGNFANLTAIEAFTVAFHDYGSLYIAQLGAQAGDKELEEEGEKLAANPNVKLEEMSPAREAIMWQKIKNAKGYLLVGMGDAHRVNLAGKLSGAGIPHERVDEALVRQQKENESKWR